MGEWLQHLLDWVGANPGWAYLAVLLAAFAESLAVVGVVVPGVMIMLGAGALIATGDLQFWPTCLSAVAGAIAGDGLSYWIGHRYRDRIRSAWPFCRHPEQLDRGIAFFERHGAKSVVLGRFFGPVRAMVPLVAGIMRMAPRQFLVANIGSALAWAPAYLAPGVKMGHFSYVGNAQIGKDVNIGAGTITCNYDGENKHQTVIHDGVFIGSDSMLVAPIEIGENSTTGAGSVVTKDVPPDTIVVGIPARQIRKKNKK